MSSVQIVLFLFRTIPILKHIHLIFIYHSHTSTHLIHLKKQSHSQFMYMFFGDEYTANKPQNYRGVLLTARFILRAGGAETPSFAGGGALQKKSTKQL